MVLTELVAILWTFMPASLANMAPVLAKRWKLLVTLDKPLDAGRTWRGLRLLGDHKTIRGFATGWLVAVVISQIQYQLYLSWPAIQGLYLFDPQTINPVLWGSLLAAGALGGDAVKSFFKRQFNVEPGQNWVPFDQIDAALGTVLAAALVLDLPLRIYLLAFITGVVLHPLINLLGWLLRIKDKPF